MAWCTAEELRAYDPTVLGNSSRYTDAQLTAVIAAAETELERCLSFACTTKTVTNEKSIGEGGYVLKLQNRPVLAVSAASIDGVSLTAGELAALVYDYEGGRVQHLGGWTFQKVILVTYTHGRFTTPPSDLLLAHKWLCMARLQPSRNPVSARASRYIPEGGNTWVMAAATATTTGVADVDGVLEGYRASGFA